MEEQEVQTNALSNNIMREKLFGAWDTVISNRAADAKKQVKELTAIVEARSLAEKEYAKALLKTCPGKSDADKLESLEDGLVTFREEARKSSTAHDAVGSKLKDDVAKPLETMLAKYIKDKNQLDTKIAKAKKQLEKDEAEYNKAKSKYYKACEQLAGFQSTHAKLSADMHVTPRDVQKAAEKVSSSQKAKDAARSTLDLAIDSFNAAQDFYIESYKQVIDEFEAMEINRMTFVTSMLHTVTEALSEVSTYSADRVQILADKFGAVDPVADIKVYVNKMATTGQLEGYSEPKHVEFEEPKGIMVDNVPATFSLSAPANFAKVDLPEELRAAAMAGQGRQTAPESEQTENVPELFSIKVLYGYTPTNSEELAIWEGEVLSVIRQDGEWFWSRNTSGQEGYVPVTYVEQL